MLDLNEGYFSEYEKLFSGSYASKIEALNLVLTWAQTTGFNPALARHLNNLYENDEVLWVRCYALIQLGRIEGDLCCEGLVELIQLSDEGDAGQCIRLQTEEILTSEELLELNSRLKLANVEPIAVSSDAFVQSLKERIKKGRRKQD